MQSPINTAKASDVDRNQVEELDQAEAVLAHYLSLDDRMRPHVKFDLEKVAFERTQAHPRLDVKEPSDVELVMSKLRGALKELCVNDLTRLDRVVLDLDGNGDCPPWQSSVLPAIAFAALRSTDSMFVAKQCEAIAVYFDPALVGVRNSQTREGVWYSKPDVYDSEGYVAVCRKFKSKARANEARQELEQACAAIRRPTGDTALEEDPIRMAGVRDIDLDRL